MMMTIMTKFAHIFSKGERVLFRDEEDYVSFNNKLAVESYMTRVGILGMSIMSTHFHCVVEYLDDEMLEVFKERIKMSYCISYARKYAGKISSCFNISNMPLEDVYSIRRALVYVLKNPVHHKVTSFALKYEFSTSSKIFMTELNPPGMVETYMKSLVSLGEIKGKRRRRITMSLNSYLI